MLFNYCYLPAGTTWKRQGSRWFPTGLLAQQATTPKSSSDFGEYCRTLALPWVVKSERGSRMASPLLVTIILPLPTAQKRRKWKKKIKRENYLKSQLEISVEKETGCPVREYSIFTKIASFLLFFLYLNTNTNSSRAHFFSVFSLSLSFHSARRGINQMRSTAIQSCVQVVELKREAVASTTRVAHVYHKRTSRKSHSASVYTSQQHQVQIIASTCTTNYSAYIYIYIYIPFRRIRIYIYVQ